MSANYHFVTKSTTLNKLWYYLDQYWDDIADPRVNHFPGIGGGLWRILAIMGAYLFFTRVYLPRFMKHRQPYELRNILLIYNSFMVACNSYFFYWAWKSIDYGRIFLNFKYPSRDDYSPETLWFLSLGWWCWMSRFADLLDTVFFVLRKKESQVTTLHLYHHTVVPILAWVSFKYNGMIPIIRMFLIINSFIHVMMYSYYALAAFGPRVRKYLWWKKYITIAQILQFVICGIYGAILYYIQTDYPIGWFIFVVGQNPLFFAMFYDFYRQSYKAKIKKQ
jgi:elongation of very long chain fatty acids protein 7